MSAEENKALFLRFFDDVWAGRIQDDPWMDEIQAAFPDLKATPDRALVAKDADENDYVVVIFTVTAIHQGDYKGIPATGKPMTFRGTTVAQMENGKIVEEFAVAEKMGAVMFGQSLHQDGTPEASTGQPFTD